MTPLRARQREKRVSAILAAARDEFQRSGFSDSKIETIAANAEVAPATIYNYFRDKAGLLLEIFKDHGEQIRSVLAEAASNPPDDPLVAIDQYFALVFDHSEHDLSRVLWREAYAASYSAPGEALGGIVTQADSHLYEDMRRLFEVLQDRGTLGSQIGAHDLSEIALAVGNLQWSRYLMGKTELEEARTDAIRQIKILLDGAGGKAVQATAPPLSRVG